MGKKLKSYEVPMVALPLNFKSTKPQKEQVVQIIMKQKPSQILLPEKDSTVQKSTPGFNNKQSGLTVTKSSPLKERYSHMQSEVQITIPVNSEFSKIGLNTPIEKPKQGVWAKIKNFFSNLRYSCRGKQKCDKINEELRDFTPCEIQAFGKKQVRQQSPSKKHRKAAKKWR